MGGILSAPKAPPTPTPLPSPKIDTSADQAQARIDELERRRRGRVGTVQTSERGLLRVNTDAAQKKSLLGE
jgi:hypothetical protein